MAQAEVLEPSYLASYDNAVLVDTLAEYFSTRPKLIAGFKAFLNERAGELKSRPQEQTFKGKVLGMPVFVKVGAFTLETKARPGGSFLFPKNKKLDVHAADDTNHVFQYENILNFDKKKIISQGAVEFKYRDVSRNGEERVVTIKSPDAADIWKLASMQINYEVGLRSPESPRRKYKQQQQAIAEKSEESEEGRRKREKKERKKERKEKKLKEHSEQEKAEKPVEKKKGRKDKKKKNETLSELSAANSRFSVQQTVQELLDFLSNSEHGELHSYFIRTSQMLAEWIAVLSNEQTKWHSQISAEELERIMEQSLSVPALLSGERVMLCLSALTQSCTPNAAMLLSKRIEEDLMSDEQHFASALQSTTRVDSRMTKASSERVAFLICSLPTRLANCLQGRVPKRFRLDSFLQRLWNLVLSALSSSSVEERDRQQLYDIFASILDHIVRSEPSTRIAIAQRTFDFLAREKNHAAVCEFRIVLCLSTDRAIEELLSDLFLVVSGMPAEELSSLRDAVVVILGDPLNRNSCFLAFCATARVFVSQHMISGPRCVPQKQTRARLKQALSSDYASNRRFSVHLGCALLDYLSKMCATSDSPSPFTFTEIVFNMIYAWADADFVRKASADRQDYLSKCIYFALSLAERPAVNEHPRFLARIMDGIQNRLASTLAEVRNAGMYIAERFSQLISPENPLSFEAEKTVDVSFFSSIEQVEQHWNSLSTTSIVDDSVMRELHTEHHRDTQQDCPPSEARITHGAASDSDDSSDSNDLLLPVYMVDESRAEFSEVFEHPIERNEKGRLQMPIATLRDCIKGIYERENVKRHRDALQKCVAFAQRKVIDDIDLHDTCAELARAITNLSNTFEMTDFVALRHSALVALVKQAPTSVVPLLTARFYEQKNFDVQQRLAMLDALVDAARDLSGTRNTGAPDVAPTDGAKEMEVFTSERAAQRAIVDRATRRWGYLTQQSNMQSCAKANSFVKLAHLFLPPLMANFDDASFGVTFLSTDGIVLSKLLFSLGSLLECTGPYHPRILEFVRMLLDFCLLLSVHPDVSVRRSVLFAILNANVACGKGGLLYSRLLQSKDGARDDTRFVVEQLLGFAEHCAANDGDDTVQSLALAFLSNIEEARKTHAALAASLVV